MEKSEIWGTGEMEHGMALVSLYIYIIIFDRLI